MSDNVDGPIQNDTANKVRKGGLLVMKGMPCKVMDVRHFKTGKHGSGKNAFVGICVFSKKKVEGSFPATANVLIPQIETNKYYLSDVKYGETVENKTKDKIRTMTITGMEAESNEEMDDVVTLTEKDELFAKIEKFHKKMNEDDDYDKDVCITVQQWGEKDKFKKVSDVKEE